MFFMTWWENIDEAHMFENSAGNFIHMLYFVVELEEELFISFIVKDETV